MYLDVNNRKLYECPGVPIVYITTIIINKKPRASHRESPKDMTKAVVQSIDQLKDMDIPFPFS